MKLFMQTIKLSSGDKTPPKVDSQMENRLKGSAQQGIFMFFLTFVWALEIIGSAMFYLAAQGIVI